MSNHEECAQCVERELQDERLTRLPNAWSDVSLYLVASTRALRANVLGVLSRQQVGFGGYSKAALDARSGQEQRRGAQQPCAALGLPKAPAKRLLLAETVGGGEGKSAATIREEGGELGQIAMGDDGVTLRVGNARGGQGRGV